MSGFGRLHMLKVCIWSSSDTLYLKSLEVGGVFFFNLYNTKNTRVEAENVSMSS